MQEMCVHDIVLALHAGFPPIYDDDYKDYSKDQVQATGIRMSPKGVEGEGVAFSLPSGRIVTASTPCTVAFMVIPSFSGMAAEIRLMFPLS